MAKIGTLLFVDTNIWLDFYRQRSKSDAIVKRLKHLEEVRDRIIVTHQVEMEFKSGRHAAIIEGMKSLVPPTQISLPGIFSEAKATKTIGKNIKAITARFEHLKKRIQKMLSNPAQYDPVYQTCQRIFSGDGDLVLTINDKKRFAIRRKAVRRFYLGCPPRKPGDTSIGDAYNWEWMVKCAIDKKSHLVILSRDNDYGQDIEKEPHLNDHLRQEFSERVSKKRKVRLCRTITEALGYLNVKVTPEEREQESKEYKLDKSLVAADAVRPEVRWAEVRKWLIDEPGSSPIADALRKLQIGNIVLYDEPTGGKPEEDWLK